MDNEVTTEVSTEVESAPTTDTSSTDTSSNTDASTDAEGETETPVETKPAFTPNFKLKVYDQEKDLEDPFLKNLIKDSESEAKVKELAQKAMGFDRVKEIHENIKTKFSNYESQTQPIVNVYQQFKHLESKGDDESMFRLLGITDQRIMQYAVRKAEEAQMSPDQQAQLQMQRQIQQEREMLANQNQSLQGQYTQQATEFRDKELGWMLQQPEVSKVAQVIDAKHGPGTFRQTVIEKALAHFAATQRDLTTEEAIRETMKLMGPLVQSTSVNGIPAAQQAQPISQNGAPPIIPNVQGKTTSPVKKQMRSINDLKKRREELSSS